MEYSNPEIQGNTNISRRHPLREIFVLLGAITALVLLAIVSLSLLAEKLAVYVPFSVEQQFAESFISPSKDITVTGAYLQSLADGLSAHMELPEDMEISVHYSDDEILNAYATLGGNIFIFQGLLDVLPSENALAMVMAHEIAHVKHRHPIIAMGRGVVIGLLIMSLVGVEGNTLAGNIISTTGMIAVMSFSRDQERDSDLTAIHAVQAHYGHINGASALFDILTDKEGTQIGALEFLSTHPVSEDRIDTIKSTAEDMNWHTEGELTPLSEYVKHKEHLQE